MEGGGEGEGRSLNSFQNSFLFFADYFVLNKEQKTSSMPSFFFIFLVLARFFIFFFVFNICFFFLYNS